MATFAFIQHRLGRTDGVSLEVDKFRHVLETHGHTVHYLAGNDDVPGGCFIPELYPFHEVTQRILQNATRELKDYSSPAELLAEVRQHAAKIKPPMLRFLREKKIDMVFPNNLQSVGFNLPGMLALHEVLEESDLPAACHNHDFWWEDSGEVYPTCPEVVAFYEEHAPPVSPRIQHLCINRLAQAELKKRKGVDARVVPNVFDFNRPSWERDAYNEDFRSAIGLGPNDIFFLQATRILDRKGVELAIDTIAALNRPENRLKLESQPLYDGRRFGPKDRLVLVCAGYVEGIGLRGNYPTLLSEKAAALGVDLIWCADQVKHSRGKTASGEKIYSLWDSYVCADFVTYPSVWEGWGNQLIEAVFAKLPVLLFEYPVYVSDLQQAGFEVVSLGQSVDRHDANGLVEVSPEKINRAAAEVIDFLQNKERRTAAVEHNFAQARQRYSYEALADHLEAILAVEGISLQQP